MHKRTNHNVLTQGRTVQKGGSNPHNPPANRTLITVGPHQLEPKQTENSTDLWRSHVVRLPP